MFSSVIFLVLFAVSASNVQADVTTHHNDIHVYHNATDNVYHVNGKVFQWSDLSSEQQVKIKPIQDKMNKIQKLFEAQEEKFSVMHHQNTKKQISIRSKCKYLLIRKGLCRLSCQFNTLTH